jgi:peptidoglycan/xylan/chitin deacetylase (PgdA/CDA1 family)
MSSGSANTTPHAVMFHHFHNDVHPQGQGSISSGQFEEMIDWLSDRHAILDAEEFAWRSTHDRLQPSDLCLSFDDALLCQVDVALPVLDRRNIKAFFFVYSSPFHDDPDPLEIYRYFRTVEFADVDEFYLEFFAEAARAIHDRYAKAESNFNPDEYLAAFPFYTTNDKWFRFLRDRTLTKPEYGQIMSELMELHSFDPKLASKRLWMNEDHLVRLHKSGHKVGLHSFSHPTLIHELALEDQSKEYRMNFDHLKSVLGEAPDSMSHPCGNYNDASLNVLRELGITIGFRSNYAITEIKSTLEVPREDHANVLTAMKR